MSDLADEWNDRYPCAHRVNNGWVVADQWWLPGLYDSEETALRAASFDDAQLLSLDGIYQVDGENRSVTMADLDALGSRR